MKIEDIKPSKNNYILSEELLEPSKSKIVLSEDAEKKLTQKVYKIRCVPENNEYKVGERVIITGNSAHTIIKLKEVYYMIIRDYDIVAKVNEA